MSISSNCTASVIKTAAESLINGNLVAFPTETVYGLGADANNKDAVSRVYTVKGRPVGHPLIVHISSTEYLDKWAREIPEYAIKLAKAFWPGPMTLILPRTNLAKDFVTGGQDNVGIRIPSHTVALELLREFESQGGLGVAAPSANRFGAVSPTSANAVKNELESYLSDSDLILDGGFCSVGVESAIIDCTRDVPVILRPGAITKSMVEIFLDTSIYSMKSININTQIKSPGLLESHYSPNASIFLSGIPGSGDGYIAISDKPTPLGVIRLASPINNDEFARILYRALRRADELGLEKVFVEPAIGDGIADAINDRLKKASYDPSL